MKTKKKQKKKTIKKRYQRKCHEEDRELSSNRISQLSTLGKYHLVPNAQPTNKNKN
jgi:hypothetical protein